LVAVGGRLAAAAATYDLRSEGRGRSIHVPRYCVSKTKTLRLSSGRKESAIPCNGRSNIHCGT